MIQACGDDDDDDPTSPPDDTGNIAEVAQSNDDFSDLVSALSYADLVSTLEGEGPFTVFAPTNAAFDEVDTSSLSQAELQDILECHVLADEVLSSEISSGTVTTVNGADLEIAVASDGSVSLTDQAGQYLQCNNG